MKYSFKICYEIDAPMAISVATYLDCEHYMYLHERLTKSIEILEHGDGYYRCRLTANTFGVKVGQSFTSRFIPPGTFVQSSIQPFPRWMPSVHHLIKTVTTMRYFETPGARTTLSELTVDLDLPFYIYPFREKLRRAIEKIKIVKDLEDVAMIDRRAKLYGRDNNTPYINKHQFMLHKSKYLQCFGMDSEFYGETPEEYRDVRWTSIKDLDFPYVRQFMEHEYHKYC